MLSLVESRKWQILTPVAGKIWGLLPPKCGLIDIPGIYTLFNA